MLPAEIQLRNRSGQTEMSGEPFERAGRHELGCAGHGALGAGRQSWALPRCGQTHGTSAARLVAAQRCDLNASDSQTPPMCLAFLWIKLLLPSERHFLGKKAGCPPARSTALSDV